VSTPRDGKPGTLAERRRADFRHGRPRSEPEPVLERLIAEAEHRQAVAEFRARRRADEQARIAALLSEVIAVLAEALEVEDRCDRCPECMRALSPRRISCPRCGYDPRVSWALADRRAA
jgi:hypothetical protein